MQTLQTDHALQRVLYFSDLICSKIDLHSEAFIKRINALCKGDKNKVEFIEKMMLEPLDGQINFLIDKALES